MYNLIFEVPRTCSDKSKNVWLKAILYAGHPFCGNFCVGLSVEIEIITALLHTKQ